MSAKALRLRDVTRKALGLAGSGVSGGARLGAKATAEGARQAWKHPGIAVPTAVVGGAALGGPILNSAKTRASSIEKQLEQAQSDPEMIIMASLDEFLESKEALFAKTASFFDNVSAGAGKALGAAGIALGTGAGLMGMQHAQDWYRKNQREKLIKELIREDPVIAQAEQQTPGVVMNAYLTMQRFAPTLSTDKNAVRSYLREAVMMGDNGVNYATIKNIAEAEKSVKQNIVGGLPQ